jgi:hypothetical protein
MRDSQQAGRNPLKCSLMHKNTETVCYRSIAFLEAMHVSDLIMNALSGIRGVNCAQREVTKQASMMPPLASLLESST